jgi:hypothetical protein
MANKNVMIILIAVAVIAVAAAGAYVLLNSDSEKGVTYNGNGGTDSDGNTSVTVTNDKTIPNLFSNPGHAFTGWNTKADGSGITYGVGDDVDRGTVLYAKWAEQYSVISYSYSSAGSFSPSFHINDRVLTIGADVLPVSLITVTGGSDWSLDSDSNVFKCSHDGRQYTLSITVSGADNVIYDLIIDTPTVGIKTSGDIGVHITCRAVV